MEASCDKEVDDIVNQMRALLTQNGQSTAPGRRGTGCLQGPEERNGLFPHQQTLRLSAERVSPAICAGISPVPVAGVLFFARRNSVPGSRVLQLRSGFCSTPARYPLQNHCQSFTSVCKFRQSFCIFRFFFQFCLNCGDIPFKIRWGVRAFVFLRQFLERRKACSHVISTEKGDETNGNGRRSDRPERAAAAFCGAMCCRSWRWALWRR